MTKKNKKTRGKPKKNKHEPQTKHSLKSFGFLVFSRFRRTSQLFDFSLGEKPWGKPKTSRKPKNQKTKTFQRMFGLRLLFGFFLVVPRFFCFFLVMTLKKLKNSRFFGFLDKLMVKDLWKTKKTQVFFVFFAWIVFTCLLKICPKNQKRPEFF